MTRGLNRFLLHRQRGNDMETFSWFDSLRALTAPCLDCLHSSKKERNDLEDLLADSGSASATTADAETLSLHSNPSSSPRRKRARFTKHIRLFGWDLFGRRQPIRLPDDDEDDEEGSGGEGEGEGGGEGEGQAQTEQQRRKKKKRRGHRGSHRRPSTVTISSSTLDSDAAPLDSAAIISHATNYAEEEVKRAERRERRRQRREMKRAAALALEQAVMDGDEFEGFQGSGSGGSPHVGSPGSPPPLGHDDRARTMTAQDLRYTPDEDDDDDDDDEGDFGGGAYTRRTSGSSDSGRGSDSRSRTSATTSASGQQPTGYPHSYSGKPVQPYNHHYISQQPPATTDAPLLPVRLTRNKSSRSSASGSKSSSSSASSTKRSRSSPSAPLSPSLASPVASAAPLPTNTNTNTTTTITPPTAPPRTTPQETFDGFTGRGPRLQTVGIESQSSSGFPSPGIGGRRTGKRDMGAFLANRGDA